ncbi:MAG: ABC transporter ATP-binding protein [Thermodesulfovibrio sp.]|nr:ABC transporter ATP-binding protein [Thermodesulfovibrio sp.]
MILDIKNVSKNFGGIKALKNINFSVKKGSIHALIGPNGAGKTTLMNIISGIEKMDSGDIYFKGFSIKDKPPYKRAEMGLARTFQNLELFGNLTVLENVIVGMYLKNQRGFLSSGIMLRGINREIVDKSLSILEYIKLSHRQKEIAKNLPVGEQRLLEVGRALATEPELILLDEPAAGLNMRETKNLSQLIQKIRDEKGITILIVEHDMELVMGISDLITVLNFGEVIAEGEPLMIQKNPHVISAYLGED